MRHIDLDLALQVLQGELPPGALLRMLLEHLKELCPECRSTLEILQPTEEEVEASVLESPEPPPLPAGRETELELRYAAAFGKAGRDAVDYAEGIRRERSRARRDLRDLRALPPCEREARIVGARSRFRSRALAELLIETSRELVRDDPAEAESLAELVPAVLLWTPGALDHPWSHHLHIRALAHRANAQRVAGNLRSADATFRQLRALARKRSVADPQIETELDSLEASLRIAQRRFEAASEILDRSIRSQRALDDHEGLARSLVQKGMCLGEIGDHVAAAAAQREALALISPETDEHLYLCAVMNLATFLCELGSHGAARDILDANRPRLERRSDAWGALRTRWLEGRIALGLGEFDTAERLLSEARAGYLEQKKGVDAAMVSMDLARLFLRQGRTRELKQCARLIQPIFESQEIHREAIAALLLFQKAVDAERVTVEAIGKLSDYLARTRTNPRPDELAS